MSIKECVPLLSSSQKSPIILLRYQYVILCRMSSKREEGVGKKKTRGRTLEGKGQEVERRVRRTRDRRSEG